MSDIQRRYFVFVVPSWLREAAEGRWVAWVDCGALLALAAGLRGFGAGRLPLWLDELFTVFWSQLPVGFLLGAGAHADPTPPLYYLFMHGWIDVFGDSPVSMHAPSVIFSSLTVPMVYLTARTLFDRETGLLAGLLAAVDPFWVMYAQEARCYALLCLTDSLAFLGLAVYFTHRGDPAMRLGGWLALFSVTVSAGVFLHFTSLFFLGACFVVVGLEVLATGLPLARTLRVWAGIVLVTALCVAYPVSLAVFVARGEAARLSWIPTLSLPVVWNFLTSAILDPQGLRGWPASVCGGLVLLAPAAGAWRLRLERRHWLLLVMLPVLFCLLLFLASTRQPVVLPRVGIMLVLPVTILLARCVLSQPVWALRWGVGAAAVAAWVVPLCLYYQAPHKEDWKAAAAIAVSAPACDGPLIYVEFEGMGLVYYQPSLMARPLYSLDVGVDQGRLIREPLDDAQSHVLQATYLHSNILYLRDAPAFVAGHSHTMLVLRPVMFSVLRYLPRPKVLAMTRGPLVVACY